MILTKNQGRSKKDKNRVRIIKSRCVKSDGTHFYIGNFNIVFSLYRVLEVTFYFSKGFSEVVARGSAVAEVLWSLKQKSSL